MGLRGLTCDLALNDLLASICNILLPLKQNANWVETESTSKICWTRQGKRGWVGWRRWVYCVVLFRAVTPDPHRRPSIKQMEEPICYILRRRQIQYRSEKYLVTPWSIHTRCSCFWNYCCCSYHYYSNCCSTFCSYCYPSAFCSSSYCRSSSCPSSLCSSCSY